MSSLCPPPFARSQASTSLERLTQYEAVGLFVERAQAVKPDFEVTNESAPSCCRDLRAPGRVTSGHRACRSQDQDAPAQAMLHRLGSRLKLLTGGARDLPERQRTFRGA